MDKNIDIQAIRDSLYKDGINSTLINKMTDDELKGTLQYDDYNEYTSYLNYLAKKYDI